MTNCCQCDGVTPPPPPVGSCCYIDPAQSLTHKVCEDNVTVNDCEVRLDGSFSTLTCAQRNNCLDLPPSCFLPNSLVLMENGSHKKISEISIGEKVRSINGLVNEVVEIEKVHLGDRKMASINNKPMFFSYDHPVLTKEGFKSFDVELSRNLYPEINFVENLSVGDIIYSEDGEVKVDQISLGYYSPDTILYDLSLDGNHLYFVNGFVFHNCRYGVICCYADNSSGNTEFLGCAANAPETICGPPNSTSRMANCCENQFPGKTNYSGLDRSFCDECPVPTTTTTTLEPTTTTTTTDNPLGGCCFGSFCFPTTENQCNNLGGRFLPNGCQGVDPCSDPTTTTTTTPSPCGSDCVLTCISGFVGKTWVASPPCKSECPCEHITAWGETIRHNDFCWAYSIGATVNGSCGDEPTTTTTTTLEPTTTTTLEGTTTTTERPCQTCFGDSDCIAADGTVGECGTATCCVNGSTLIIDGTPGCCVYCEDFNGTLGACDGTTTSTTEEPVGMCCYMHPHTEELTCHDWVTQAQCDFLGVNEGIYTRAGKPLEGKFKVCPGSEGDDLEDLIEEISCCGQWFDDRKSGGRKEGQSHANPPEPCTSTTTTTDGPVGICCFTEKRCEFDETVGSNVLKVYLVCTDRWLANPGGGPNPGYPMREHNCEAANAGVNHSQCGDTHPYLGHTTGIDCLGNCPTQSIARFGRNFYPMDPASCKTNSETASGADTDSTGIDCCAEWEQQPWWEKNPEDRPENCTTTTTEDPDDPDDPDDPNDPNDPEDPDYTWLWIVIALISVLLLGGGAILFFSSNETPIEVSYIQE